MDFRFARARRALAALAWGGLLALSARAAGTKINGATVVVDDLPGGSAGTVQAVGGGRSLDGAIAPGASGVAVWMAANATVAEAGYFTALTTTPTAVAFVAVSSNSLTAQWTVTNPTGTLYTIDASTASDFSGALKSTSVYASSALFTGLRSNTTYYVRYRANYMDGDETAYVSLGSAETAAYLPAGCAFGYNVSQDGLSDYATIGAALAALPTGLDADTCVVIRDAATYAEQVAVANFANNGHWLKIVGSTPVSGTAPAVNPPSGATAGFWLANASVAVQGINVTPTNSVAYGVLVSSSGVAVSSVNVLDGGGRIGVAGVAVATATGTSIFYSSVTVGGSGAAALLLTRAGATNVVNGYFSSFAGYGYFDDVSSSTTLSGSYVQGTTGVSILGSTGTVVSGNTLAATSASGSALQLTGGSVGLSARQNVLRGGASGAGARLDAGNSGALFLSTNTFPAGAQYALYAGTTTPGTALWIASNTVIPTVSAARSTYGLYFDGLSAGATAHNNGIYYRTPGSMTGFVSYAIFAQNSAGLTIDHNRISNPNMIVGGPPSGGFVGVYLATTTATILAFNDVNSSGTSLSPGYQVQLVNAPSAAIKSNIFSNNMSPFSGQAPTLNVDLNSQSGFASNFNTLQGSAQTGRWGVTTYVSLSTWQANVKQDLSSLSSDPLWANPGAGAEDFHVKSAHANGRYDPATGGFTADDGGVGSPTIDAGDPAESVGDEPIPHGGRANQGSYGQTAQASKSAIPAGCDRELTVAPGFYPDIGSAVAAVGASLSDNPCVVIRQYAVYVEQVDVRGIATNGHRLAIMGDPTLSPRPVVDPIGQTAAFVIANDSVTIATLDIAPTGAASYGILATSAAVTISSVNVDDAGGHLTAAGVLVSTAATVRRSSVTASSVPGLIAIGFGAAVSYSSAAAGGASGAALYLNGASSATVTLFYASNPSGAAVKIANGAYGNAIALSTMTGGAGAALDLNGAWANAVTRSVVAGTAHGARLKNSYFNTLSSDTVTSAGASSAALDVSQSSNNVVAVDSISNAAGGDAVFLDTGANLNAISGSTLTAAAATTYGALRLSGASSNAVTASVIANPSGSALSAQAHSDQNRIGQSTVATTSGGSAASLADSAGNSFVGSYLANAAASADALFVAAGASFTVVAQSTLTAGGASGVGALVAAPNATIVGGWIGAAGGIGVSFLRASSNTLTSATVVASTAVSVNASTNTLVFANALTASGGGAGVFVTGGSAGLTAAQNTIAAGGGGVGVDLDAGNSGALLLSTNTILSGARIGVDAGSPAAGAAVWIASNTILPVASASYDTFGLYLNGLTSGATVQGNGVYYRVGASGVSHTTVGLYGLNSSGVTILHNRFSNPGMVTAGSYYGILLSSSPAATVKFNDLHAVGTGLTDAYLLRVSSGSTGATVADDVFLSSFVVSGAAALLAVDANAAAGLHSDYNAFYSSAAAVALVAGQDAHSLLAHPRWKNVAAGAEDFHPLSQGGSCADLACAAFAADGWTAGTLDGADPAESAAREPAPNGGRANLGSYGGTAEASKTPAAPGAPTAAVFTSSIGVSYALVGADGYEVLAATASDFTGTVAVSSTPNAPAGVLTPTGLGANTTYFLKLEAVWGDLTVVGATVLSSATLAYSPAAAAPAFLAVHVGSATASWLPNGNPVDVTTYTVVFSTGAVFPNADAGDVAVSTAAAGAAPSLAVAGLNANTTYYAFAAAVNWAGTPSDYALLGSTSTRALPPAAAATAFSAVRISSVSLAWSSGGNPPGLTRYVVQASTASDFNAAASSVTLSTTPAAAPAATLTALIPATTYYFRVQAVGNAGDATAFAALGSTATASAPPTGFTLTATSTAALAAAWTDALNPAGTLYELQVSADPAFVGATTSSRTYNTSVSTAGLAVNTTYYFRLQAFGAGGAGSGLADVGAAATLAVPPASAASTFSAVAITSFTVHWNAGGNPPGTLYVLQASTDPGFSATASSASVSTAPFGAPAATVTGLSSDATYYVRVQALNDQGAATAFTGLGSTTTLLSDLLPQIVDGQAGDATWRRTNDGLYHVSFVDASGTHLDKFQVKASTTPGGAGADLVAFTDVVVGLAVDAYSTPWSLPASVFSALPEGVTAYITVRVYNHVPSTATYQDAFYVLKDTTAPTLVDAQAGDDVVRSSQNATYAVGARDATSGLAAFQYSVSLTPRSGDAALVPWTDIATLAGATSYATPWPVNFAALASGVTNYVSVRAWDVAGATTTLIDAFHVLKDTAGPAVALSSPSSAGYLSSLPLIQGTAASVFGVQGAEVSVQQGPPGGLYWNPAAATFNAASPVWMAASGTAAWSLSPGIPWANGTTYQVVARSSTTFNVYSATYATATFVLDASTPTVGVTSPTPDSTVSTLAQIAGTAADPAPTNSGISSVEVRLRRNSDGLWWNWFAQAWSAVAVSTVPSGTTAWSLTPPPRLLANLRNGASYFVAVRASDNASPPNQGDFTLRGATFTWQDVTPPAAVADLAAANGTAPGAIVLSWTAPGDDGGSGLILSGQYAVFYATDAAAVASTAAAQVSFSTALVNAGDAQSYVLTGLLPGATYFLRLALSDDDGNWSAFSNRASTTAAPAPSNAIGGHVVNASTQGVTAVEIDCWDAGGALVATTFTLADGSGTFVVAGLTAGSYKLKATWTANGVASSVWQDHIPMGSVGVDFALEINYALATLTGDLGTLTTASAGGGGHAPAAYRSGGATASRVELFQQGRQVAQVPVPPSGRWVIPNLLPGKYSVRAFTGLSYTRFQDVELKEGDVKDVGFVFDPLPAASVFAFPNPARAATTIRFATALSPLEADILIFDVAGNLVREIPGSEIQPVNDPAFPDVYHATWDLTNGRGRPVASGVYLVLVKVKGGSQSQIAKAIKKVAVVR